MEDEAPFTVYVQGPSDDPDFLYVPKSVLVASPTSGTVMELIQEAALRHQEQMAEMLAPLTKQHRETALELYIGSGMPLADAITASRLLLP